VSAGAGPLKDVFAARFAYQGAVNDLYVYGSDAAWKAHAAIAALLPTSLRSQEPEIKPINLDAFEGIECREVPETPRSGC